MSHFPEYRSGNSSVGSRNREPTEPCFENGPVPWVTGLSVNASNLFGLRGLVVLCVSLFYDAGFVFYAVAESTEIENFAVMDESIQNRRGNHRIMQELRPFIESFVGG